MGESVRCCLDLAPGSHLGCPKSHLPGHRSTVPWHPKGFFGTPASLAHTERLVQCILSGIIPWGNLLENLWDRSCSISPQDEGSGSKDLLCLEVTLVKPAELCCGPDKSIYSKCYANSTRIWSAATAAGIIFSATCPFNHPEQPETI